MTPGDVDDRKPLEYKAFIDLICGKLAGDKGYISKNLFERLFVNGIQIGLLTRNGHSFKFVELTIKFL